MTGTLIKRLMQCVNRIDGKYYSLTTKSAGGENRITVLYALYDHGELSQKSLCNDWLIPKTTINTIIHKLMDEGFVEISARAGKEKMLTLTDAGREYSRKVLKNIWDAEEYAMNRTLEKFDKSFIDAMELYAEYFAGCSEVKNDR